MATARANSGSATAFPQLLHAELHADPPPLLQLLFNRRRTSGTCRHIQTSRRSSAAAAPRQPKHRAEAPPLSALLPSLRLPSNATPSPNRGGRRGGERGVSARPRGPSRPSPSGSSSRCCRQRRSRERAAALRTSPASTPPPAPLSRSRRWPLSRPAPTATRVRSWAGCWERLTCRTCWEGAPTSRSAVAAPARRL